MTLEPAHFRGCCVPFELNRRDGAIGVGRRFRGKRQGGRSCGRRSGQRCERRGLRRGDDRRRRRRGGGPLRRGQGLVTFERAHFRGQRVAFARDRRDGAIGVGRRFRGGRQGRRSCGGGGGGRGERRGRRGGKGAGAGAREGAGPAARAAGGVACLGEVKPW